MPGALILNDIAMSYAWSQKVRSGLFDMPRECIPAFSVKIYPFFPNRAIEAQAETFLTLGFGLIPKMSQ